MKSTITLTRVSVPLRERKWVDVDPGWYDHECYVTAKAMTRLLGHVQNVPREIDGAIKYKDIVEHILCTYSASQNAPHRYFTHASRVAQELRIVRQRVVCHPSVMSHMLAHLPQNNSARSLSPTSPVFRPSSLSLTRLVSAHSGYEYETLRDPRRRGGYTISAFPTLQGDSWKSLRLDPAFFCVRDCFGHISSE